MRHRAGFRSRDAAGRSANDRAGTDGNLGAPGAGTGAEHRGLEVFIGKWINEGKTVATPDAPAATIVTSDVYEWIPGRFAVLRTACGRTGDLDFGGVEIIGCDAESGRYTSHFFDSQGHGTVDQVRYDDGSGPGPVSGSVQRPSSASTAGSGDHSTSRPRTRASDGWAWT